MELDPLHRKIPVPHAHDHPFPGPGAYLQAVRHGLRIEHQGMIATCRKGAGETPEQGAPVMVDVGCLSVENGRGPHHAASEGHTDGLVPEADPQERRLPCHLLHKRHRDAGPGRSSRPRRNDNALVAGGRDLPDADGVVPDDVRLRAQLAQVLDEVVGEGIVVVQNQDPLCPPSDGVRAQGTGSFPMLKVTTTPSSSSGVLKERRKGPP